MAEYSRIAKGTVLSTGGATSVILPFLPNIVEIRNYTAATTPATGGIPFAYWDANMGQGFAQYDVFNATPVLTTATTSTGGISTFQGGLALQYGTSMNVSTITKASPAVVTTASAHGLVSGNVVVFQNLYQTSTTGMQQIAGIPFVVTVTGSTTFTIPWNTNQSNYTAYSSGGATVQATVKQVLYPALYAPGTAVISAISTGSTTTITTTATHNYVVGQEVAFRIPSSWGTTQLNSLPNVQIPGSPIYAFVTAVGSSTTFTISTNSSTYTAFNSNIAFTSFPGLSFPTVVAVGDVNSGSLLSNFTSPSFYNGTSTSAVQTINGPAVAGAFCNNTSQGFIIGGTIAGAATNVIYWKAILVDYSNP